MSDTDLIVFIICLTGVVVTILILTTTPQRKNTEEEWVPYSKVVAEDGSTHLRAKRARKIRQVQKRRRRQ